MRGGGFSVNFVLRRAYTPQSRRRDHVPLCEGPSEWISGWANLFVLEACD